MTRTQWPSWLVLASCSTLMTAAQAAAPLPGVPANALFYQETPVGAGQTCVAAATTEDDGMNEKPVVHLEGANGIAWHMTLPLPADTYQARATHCIGTPTTLYVLVQGDTQPEQTLSQTLLEVVALQRTTGSVVASRAIDVPNVSAAHTTWVDEGSQRFVARDGHLAISGQYATLADRDHPIKFSLQVPEDLTH